MTRHPKLHDMTATVDLGQVAVKPETSIRVLGLQVDGKLDWKAHLKKVGKKMVTQERGLTCLSASTWGARLQKSRTVYQAVVKPAITYAAAIWHAPKGTPGHKSAPTQQLQLIQNRCLRVVSGAYKATPVPVLESEVFMPPIELALNQVVVQARLKRGTHPATTAGNERIRQHLKRLKARRGKRTPVEPLPTKAKLSWAREKLDLTYFESFNRGPEDAPPEAKEAIAKRIARAKAAAITRWTVERWTGRWRRYRDSIPLARRHPALDKDEITEAHLRRHGIMRKGDSALAIQLRTGKNGLAHFLFTTYAKGRTDVSCDCG